MAQELITDVDVHDVMVRVLSHFFPGARYSCPPELDLPAGRGFFRVPYDGKIAEPRAVLAVDIEKAGPLQAKPAQRFLATVPGKIVRDAHGGEAVGGYGSCVSVQDISAGHLKFDDQLVSEHVVPETARYDRGQRDVRETLALLFKFLRLASEHRYESEPPEISLILRREKKRRKHESLGLVSLDLFGSVKAALTLGSEGAAAFAVTSDGTLEDVIPLPCAANRLRVPTRLSALAALSVRGGAICVHLDRTPSICVMARGVCRFRYMNGRWGWLAHERFMKRMPNKHVGFKTLRLALDLCDTGSGAILVLVDREKHGKRIQQIANPECTPVLFGREEDLPPAVSKTRGQFNRWLMRGEYTLDNTPWEFLLNLCRVDGATFIDRNDGRVLGYGAVVKVPRSAAEQGARTTAARYLATQFGAAVKVSEDRIAMLFEKEEGPPCRIW